MGEIIDLLLVLGIFSFIGLQIWSRIQNQRVLDCLYEIKEFIQSFNEEVEEVV